MRPLVALLLLLVLLPLAPPAAAFDHSHAEFSKLLQAHVAWNAAGTATTVDYAALARDRAKLNEYARSLSAVPQSEFARWSMPERHAFLINAYNAFTLELILSRYPNLASIRDLGNIVFNSPWKRRFFSLLGKQRHLDEVEHELLRGAADFDEPRIHFAVNCASIGCPALRPEAFRADRLDAQLADQTRRFLRDRTRNRLSSGPNLKLEISPIFKWYGGDFEAGHRGIRSVQSFIAHYADAIADTPELRARVARADLEIRYTEYDWALNARR
jgi:hypothetical protein